MPFRMLGNRLIVDDSGHPIECSTCICPEPCDPSCLPNTQPPTVVFSVRNVSNESCTSCDQLNVDYFLTRVSGLPCSYEGEAVTDCGDVFINFDYTPTQVNGGFQLNGIPVFGFVVNTTAPYDCTIGREFTITSPSTSPCNFSTVTSSYVGGS